MWKIMTIAAAALIGGNAVGAPPAQAQQADRKSGQGAPTKPLPTGACRVKEQAGGRTCTGNVPEAACAAIAREAKGSYTWTMEECP